MTLPKDIFQLIIRDWGIDQNINDMNSMFCVFSSFKALATTRVRVFFNGI